MKNIDIGNRDEKRLCKEIFQKNHFYAYNTPRDNEGKQPVDVIAFKGLKDNLSVIFMVDSKNVSLGKKRFDFRYIRQDQEDSMSYAIEWCNVSQKYLGFVIFFEEDFDNPRWLSFEQYNNCLKENEKSVSMNNLPLFLDILKNL